MNKKIGKISSVVTLLAVLGFSLSMIFKSDFGSYLSSMFIAWGFVPLICSFAAYSEKETKAFGYAAIAFSSIYATLIMIVYFSQLTSVRFLDLSQQASQILDYKTFGLFFSYDLLGYGFMALSTFFISFTIKSSSKGNKWLKTLLLIHGFFVIVCVAMPILGTFKPDMKGGEIIGTLVLESWCAYFIPICLLSYNYFKKNSN